MTLLTETQSVITPDITKVIGYLFNVAILIIGWFLVSTLKDLKTAIQNNTAQIQKNKEDLIKANSQIETIKEINIKKLDDIQSTLKEFKQYVYDRLEKIEDYQKH